MSGVISLALVVAVQHAYNIPRQQIWTTIIVLQWIETGTILELLRQKIPDVRLVNNRKKEIFYFRRKLKVINRDNKLT